MADGGGRATPSRRSASPGHRADVVEVLSKLLAGRPGVTLGKMFGFPAFYTRGKLFACVYGDGVGLKLPEAMVRALEGQSGIAAFRPYGTRKMREWIHIRRASAGAYRKDAPLFRASIRHVAGAARRAARPAGRTGQPSRRARRAARAERP